LSRLAGRFVQIPKLLGIMLAIGALVWVAFHIDLSQAFAEILKANILLLALAFAGFYLSLPLRALRWQILLRQQQGHVPISFLMRAIFQAWFVNCTLPGRAGDVYAAYLMKSRCDLSMTKSAGTIFTARVLDLAVLLGLVTLLFLVHFRHILPPVIATVVYSGLIMGLVLAVVLGTMAITRGFAARMLPGRLGYYYERFFGAFVGSFRRLPTLVALTLALWLLEVVRLGCVLAAVGASPPLAWICFLALTAAVLTTLPITPGGLGTVELFYLEMFPLAGIPTGVIGGVIILDRIINYWFILIAGALLLLTDRSTRVDIIGSRFHAE
jgi:uncharacterized protein (TIRG00374 family)